MLMASRASEASGFPLTALESQGWIKVKLNDLEKEILRVVGIRARLDALAIESRLGEDIVLKRENTGAGFYTTLKPIKFGKLFQNTIIGNAAAKIEEMANPMVFVVFLENGYIIKLEGAAVEESTADIDFSKVTFEIIGQTTH
jgi:hypothetical protein